MIACSVIGVIPARYASVRFPGKPLAPLAGRPMVLHVLEAARAARRLDRVVVATDDARIAGCVRGGRRRSHPDVSATAASGTDRVAEVARAMPADVYVNIQGDEPMMPAENIDRAVDALLAAPGRPLATLAIPDPAAEAAADPNTRQGRRRPRRAGALLLALADPLLPQRRAVVSQAPRASTPTARRRSRRWRRCRPRRSSARSRSSSCGGSRRDIRSGWERRRETRSAWTRPADLAEAERRFCAKEEAVS